MMLQITCHSLCCDLCPCRRVCRDLKRGSIMCCAPYPWSCSPYDKQLSRQSRLLVGHLMQKRPRRQEEGSLWLCWLARCAAQS